jgi:hypothetical protein
MLEEVIRKSRLFFSGLVSPSIAFENKNSSSGGQNRQILPWALAVNSWENSSSKSSQKVLLWCQGASVEVKSVKSRPGVFTVELPLAPRQVRHENVTRICCCRTHGRSNLIN